MVAGTGGTLVGNQSSAIAGARTGPRIRDARSCCRGVRLRMHTMEAQTEFEHTRRMFLLGAALMLAHLVAGKALRDGLFLSQFSPSDLPKVMAAAALFSVLLG